MLHLRRFFSVSIRTKMPTLPTVVSVIGATGTGKSQLAVELARRFNGEIINADAMQMYAGLPIITNKIAEEEKCGVPHHMLGFLDVHKIFTVGQFVHEAERIIADIHDRGKLPIVVGGTHYYVQSLLYGHSVRSDEAESDENVYPFPPIDVQLVEKYPILDEPTPVLYEKLKSVDPLIAAKWHPNDRRKIRRSLEIYYSTDCKQTASEIYAAQRAAKQEALGSGTGTTRYANLIFWVHAETDPLRERLDKRVDKMILAGMWEEIEEMEEPYVSMGGPDVDLNRGIWQTIGFKEFLPYLNTRKHGEHSEEELQETRAEAVARMKTSTRQYAKSQVKWIRIKLLNALAPGTQAAQNSKIYVLDSTDLDCFNDNVIGHGTALYDSFRSGDELPPPSEVSSLAHELEPKRDYDFSQRPDLWVQHTCEICNVVSTNEVEWEIHLKCARHRKAVGKAAKRAENLKFMRRRLEKEEGEKKKALANLVNVLETRVALGDTHNEA